MSSRKKPSRSKSPRQEEVEPVSPNGNGNGHANGHSATKLSFTPLPSQTTTYLNAIKDLVRFKEAIAAELEAIDEKIARTPKNKLTEGNPYETPRKKLLSAQVELTRMDYMEEPSIAQLLYKSTHFSEDERDAKEAFDATPEMREVDHVLALYEDLRSSLTIRPKKQSSLLGTIFRLILTLFYTLFTIPIFVLNVFLVYLNPLWTFLYGAKNHSYPIDVVQKLYARGQLWLCSINVEWKGIEENVNVDQPTVGMFSHGSNLDPVIVASGPLAFKWIGKKSLFKIPVIGWTLSGLQHIPIDRENREKAIASLKKAAETINKYKRCIAISPEGTRSKTGRIQDFKKGAFHTAMAVQVPITPVLVEGAFELWPSECIFTQPGNVRVTFLKPIPITPNDNYNALASKVRRAFLHELERTATIEVKEEETGSHAQSTRGKPYTNYGLACLWLPASYLVLYIMYLGLRSLFI